MAGKKENGLMLDILVAAEVRKCALFLKAYSDSIENASSEAAKNAVSFDSKTRQNLADSYPLTA